MVSAQTRALLTSCGASAYQSSVSCSLLMLVAVQCSGYKQVRVRDAAVHHSICRPAAHDGVPIPTTVFSRGFVSEFTGGGVAAFNSKE